MARSSFSGGNAGAPALDVGRIHLGKQVVHVRQGLVDHDADHPQGVIKGHEVIEMAHREQALGEGVGSAHGWLVCLVSRGLDCRGWAAVADCRWGVFQQPATACSLTLIHLF